MDTPKGIEVKLGPPDKDIFDEIFGPDEERELAKQRMLKELEERKKANAEERKKTRAHKSYTLKAPSQKHPSSDTPNRSAREDNSDKLSQVPSNADRSETTKAEKSATVDASAKPQPPQEMPRKDVSKTKQEERGVSVKKHADSKPILPKLSFLEHPPESVFIGRKRSVYERWGEEGGLFIGLIAEEHEPRKKVLLDSLNPHVIFVCGARGSGKSYVLGVIAEELALKNKNVASVVVDPIGVFWSMRFPNREPKEVEKLKKWGMQPKGLSNLTVLIPKGKEKDTPKGTYDSTYAIKPSLLETQDWCYTFGIERFSPTGLLLEKALYKVRHGYRTTSGEKIEGKQDYSLDDLIFCLENDAELNSRERGYKPDSIRALASRLEAAKSWGVFDKRGTPLTEICREGRLTVIDTSFLDDNVTALVIGILARRILAARKISTRKEAAKRLETDVEEALELEIPPTWLFIDEAHTLIPSGNVKTAATDALIEYVKQGRRPGCSVVFATQQPSAIDTKVLSQLDIIMVHKLVFSDDIKAVFKRIPTIVPSKFRSSTFVKTLPVGVALVGDRREETSRAFVLEVRPRMSQHEGREAETVEQRRKMPRRQVMRLLLALLWSRLERFGKLAFTEVEEELKRLNRKYEQNIVLEEVLKELEGQGAKLDKEAKMLTVEVLEEEQAAEPEEERAVPKTRQEGEISEPEKQPEVRLKAMVLRYSKTDALKRFNALRKKRFLGLFGEEEIIDRIELKYLPVFKVNFLFYGKRNTYREGRLYINAITGEFIHLKQNKLVESSGLSRIYPLTKQDLVVLNFVGKNGATVQSIAKHANVEEKQVKTSLKRLITKKLVVVEKKGEQEHYRLAPEIDLPPHPFHEMLTSIELLPLTDQDVVMRMPERYTKKMVSELLAKIWGRMHVTNIEELYLPVYEACLKTAVGKKRYLYLDAVTLTEIKVRSQN